MTMTLDEVNQIRFPMARRPNEGYRAQEVDEFVDRVVATFQSMNDESERAKAQLQALKSDSSGGQGVAEPDQSVVEENARLKQQLAEAQARLESADHAPQGQGQAVDSGELDGLRQRNAELEQRVADLEKQLSEARAQAQAAPVAASQNASAQLVEHGTGKLERLVVTTSANASPAVIRLVQLATEQAESVVADAERDADGVRSAAAVDAKKTRDEADTYAAETSKKADEYAAETSKKADEYAAETSKKADEYAANTTKAADEKASQIHADATASADSLLAQAKQNADQVEVDAKNRRAELFQTLENERDEFASKVDSLKAWEASYRSSLTSHLRGQADALDSGTFAPADPAALLGDQRTSSATPRLDALLAQKQ